MEQDIYKRRGDVNNRESITKPTYDARLEYYRVMRHYMENVAGALQSMNFLLAVTNLRSLLSMVAPYMKASEVKQAKTLLTRARAWAKSKKSSAVDYTEELLHEASDTIYSSSAKQLFLPQAEVEDDEFDEKSLLEGE